jgi:putative ABC transport system ATP-binding protein
VEPSNTPYLFETLDLEKAYPVGSQMVHALRGVSTAVSKGEFTAVMGPSGSGKSTFMNLLGCLDTPTSGQYLLEGVAVSGLPATQRAHIRNQRIGFVFQSFNLLPRTSALENTALPLRYAGIPRRKRLARAEEVLTLVGLGDRLDHYPSQLSGGQQQRVAIARALVNDPALILADEPTGALDSRTGTEVMSVFQDLNREGMTIVVVTHDPEVADFTQRILLFRDGLLVGDRPTVKAVDARALLEQGKRKKEAAA